MKKIAVIGECMVELFQKNGVLHQTFGGDTFNFAVYLKRENPSLIVEYISAVGGDFFSRQMLEFFQSHEISHQFTAVLPSSNCGLYAITTDKGERSFTYWRDASAAKYLALCPAFEQFKQQITDFELIFFSGITLAILQKESRAPFFDCIQHAKEHGVQIAFDPNYRANLFTDTKEARDLFQKARSLCDIYLPSFEDESNLLAYSSPDEVIQLAINAKVREIVIKCGKDAVQFVYQGERGVVPTDMIKQIVDSTSAGDSFNGAYLAARLNGHDAKFAIAQAQKLTAQVIMHQGAIIPLP